ncbi:hypothetical protein VARIO8X_110186 [Burkholderiales bacterium 8X]|nr:hypothetical protein VARIO8X_110186 [Burkholderiales bacterium 8X]
MVAGIHDNRSTMTTSSSDILVAPPGPHPAGLEHHPHEEHHDTPVGWRRWMLATNHKDIGTLYLLFSLTMLMVGGVLALAIRAELFQPGLQLFNPELYNQFVTMHGLIMVFGAIMPAFVGFANWMVRSAPAGRSTRRSACRWARRWISASSPSTSWVPARSWARSTSS